MARSTRKQSKARPPKDLVEASLDLFAAHGYAKVTLADIAEAAGLTLPEVLEAFSTKGEIVAAWLARIDIAMVEGTEASPEDTPRDRLFDVVMRRFDLLAPRRELVRDLVRSARSDPMGLGLVLASSLRRTIRWMIAAAGNDADGIRGLLVRKGLAAVYADTVRIWLGDETEDQARTMAHLDKRLRQAGDLLNRFTSLRRKPETSAS